MKVLWRHVYPAIFCEPEIIPGEGSHALPGFTVASMNEAIPYPRLIPVLARVSPESRWLLQTIHPDLAENLPVEGST